MATLDAHGTRIALAAEWFPREVGCSLDESLLRMREHARRVHQTLDEIGSRSSSVESTFGTRNPPRPKSGTPAWSEREARSSSGAGLELLDRAKTRELPIGPRTILRPLVQGGRPGRSERVRSPPGLFVHEDFPSSLSPETNEIEGFALLRCQAS